MYKKKCNKPVIHFYSGWFVVINDNQNLHKYMVNCKDAHSIHHEKTGKGSLITLPLIIMTRQLSNRLLILLSIFRAN